MTSLKPNDVVLRWKKDSAVRRLFLCAGMLHVHGFMTRRERIRVQARLVKWVDEHHSVMKKGRRT